jgi:hypothetical protein
MRIVRLLVVALLGAAALCVAVPSAGALLTHSLITMEGSGGNVGYGADYLVDDAHGSLTGTAVTDGFQFVGALTGGGDSGHSLDIDVSWPATTTLTAGTTYPVTRSPAGDEVGMSLFLDSGFCYATSGSMAIQDLGVGTFGATYSGITCGTGSSTTAPTLSGVLLWNSSSTFQAVDVSPRSWDFGYQPTKVTAQPRKLTFTNRGTDPVGFGAATLSNTTAFGIKSGSNTCSGHSFLPGDSCSIIVVTHPQRTGSPQANLTLASTTAGVRSRFVKLAVTAHNYVTTYALAGAEKVHLHWRSLPAPLGAVVDHYRINRGTSLHALHALRNTSKSCCPVDVYDTNVRAGTTYYYSIQPVFAGGDSIGVATPAVASDPWPKYSAGMYHKVHPFRLVSDRVVRAGHPLSLRALGSHQLPGSGVSALALDVLASNASSSTEVRVYPTGSSQPAAADLAVPAGGTRTNFVIAAVGRRGHITISATHGSTPVTIDVSGYFSGRGLSHGYGQGGAWRQYLKSGTIMDTKKFHIGALKHDYYVNCPVNFSSGDTPHVTSLIVQVTAYGATKPGTITGFTTNGRATNTVALAYGAGGSWSNTAIVAAGIWHGQTRDYPSASFLNRGPSPVQLKVTILGFVDDNYYLSGQRYQPTTGRRLFAGSLGAGSRHTVRPGSYGDRLTTAFNVKVDAAHPTRDTSISLWAAGLRGAGTASPQLLTHGDTSGTTPVTTGAHNQFYVKNAAGRVALTVWSYGFFDAWPMPARKWYVAGPNAVVATPSTVPSTVPDAVGAATPGQLFARAARQS